MSAQTELYDLVMSLTSHEKRYFNLTSELHKSEGDKNYVLLFEAIEEQVKEGKGYNEVAIKLKFADTKLGKNLPQIKAQLKTILQDMLVQFHKHSSREAEVFQLLHLQEILYDRRLYQQSEKILQKAAKIARDYELIRLLPEINYREQMLLLELEIRNLPGNLANRGELHTNDIENLNQFWIAFYAHQSAMAAYREKAGKSSVVDHPLPILPSGSAPGSFWIVYYSLAAKAILCRIKGDLLESYEAYKQLLELWRGRPWGATPRLRPQENRVQIKLLSNYLNIAFQVDRFEEFQEIRDELLEIGRLSDITLDEEAELFQNVRFLELRMCMNTAEIAYGEKLIGIIIEEFKRYEGKVNRSRSRAFYFNLGVFLFMKGDFSTRFHGRDSQLNTDHTAVYWLEKVLEPPKTDVRKDLEIASLLLLTICILEQDGRDTERAINALEALKRQLQTDRRLESEFEKEELESERTGIKLILRVFKKLGDPNGTVSQEFNELAAWCKNGIENPDPRGLQWLHPVYFWSLATLKNRTILEIYLEETASNRGDSGEE